MLALKPALCGQMLWLTFKVGRAGASIMSEASEPRFPGLGIRALTLLPA
jgi:hypothetical protein